METGLEVAHAARLRPILDVALEAGLEEEEVLPFGRFRAKVELTALERLKDKPDGRIVVVTGMTPTSAGEGKTTSAISLTQGLGRLGTKVALCLREPSIGPLFGVKGGGTGGGLAQLAPMEEINLHFNGDMHAVAAAHNLLAAAVDASLFHGNPLGIESSSITWPRTLDVNDRALRHVVIGLGGRVHGVPRESSFVITAASEVMAILALAKDLSDLRRRLGRIVIGTNREGQLLSAEDLQVAGAMTVLLRESLLPNLVQTLEGQPAFVHAGPFGNIAHGNNSLLADRVALKLAEVVVTEAGFGADLGFEKFCHIVARYGGPKPAAAVLVATSRALKIHGGVSPAALAAEDLKALERGAENLAAHIDIVHAFGVPCVVAVNRLPGDSPRELEALIGLAGECGAEAAVVHDGYRRGGAGAEELAQAVLAACERPAQFAPVCPPGMDIHEQIRTIAHRLYGAEDVEFLPDCEHRIAWLHEHGLGQLPVCVAKTHLSLSHNPAWKGRPRGFVMPVRDVSPSVGAGFVVALCGDIQLMPGLGREPAFKRIDIDAHGRIVGLT